MGVFIFYCILHRKSCKQTVQTLITCHILWHLNWVCTICIGPQNGFPVFKGLSMLKLHVVVVLPWCKVTILDFHQLLYCWFSCDVSVSHCYKVQVPSCLRYDDGVLTEGRRTRPDQFELICLYVPAIHHGAANTVSKYSIY